MMSQPNDQAQYPRILVVDDDQAQHFLMQETLEPEGYEVDCVDGGRAALHKMETVAPDLVILDLIMPGMDGFTTCERIRANKKWNDIPILVTTGLDDPDSIERAFSAGADNFITKPINWALLKHSVSFVLKSSKNQVRLRQREEQLLEVHHYARFGHWSLDVKTQTVEWSDEIYNILGLDRNIPAGIETLERIAHPEDFQCVFSSLEKSLKAAIEHNIDYRIVRPDGEERWVNCCAKPIQGLDGTLIRLDGFFQDITERRRAEQALYDERAFLQHIIDGISDPILVIGSNYDILRMNKAAQEKEDLYTLKSPCLKRYQVTHENELPCAVDDQHLYPLSDVLKTGYPTKLVHNHVASNGQQRTFEVAASPLLDDDGNILGVIEASRDITEYLTLLDELKENKLSYAHLAQYDPLTGLPNRLLFADRLSQAIHSAHRNNNELAVLFIDLDRFKHINDSFDHSYGDELLKAVAIRLLSLFCEGDTVARMGSDEFTVILPYILHNEDAALVASRVLHIFNEPFNIQRNNVYIRASIGISVYPQHGTTVDKLLRNAHAAMYRAKEKGRSTFQYYTEALTAKAFERVQLETNLHKALEREELLLYYQPQYDLITGDVCGFEALIRWKHPEMGLVSPAKFIPLAEESGIILPMGEWVLREACRQMKVWLDVGIVLPDTQMSVNLSVKQFDQKNLVATTKKILQETGLKPETLELEVTESAMMTSPEASTRNLQQLRELGVKVAIDDFGTGYSSLNYLKCLPLTKLKIDQSFVSDIPHDANNIAITRAIIALAKSLSLQVLAEGIETPSQQSFLTQEGCHIGQGFLLCKPLCASDIEAYMKKKPI